MKCAEQYPESTYQECQLDLGHSGDHDYLGTKWARPEPTEGLDPEISDLIERAAGDRVWDLDERQWPIVVTVTNVYVIKAPGATEDEALKYWDSSEYPDLDGEQTIDGDFEISRLDRWQRSNLTAYSPIGPEIACPDCGRQAMQREWYHDPFRRCHGPIQWRENTNARALKWRYSREHKATPLAVTA